MNQLENLKIEYWKVIAKTRTSGRISPNLKKRIEKQWDDYDEDIVIEALRTHMNGSTSCRERYTIGIMKNMQKARVMEEIRCKN